MGFDFYAEEVANNEFIKIYRMMRNNRNLIIKSGNIKATLRNIKFWYPYYLRN